VNDLKGKLALVTGGSRGIGKAIVDCLSNNGATVMYSSTKDVDFSDDESVVKYIDKIKAIEFDILVNNAGICINNPIEDISYEDFDKVQKVNLYGPFKITQAVCKGMKERGYGRIVNISSIKGTGSSERRLSYTTSKSGLNGMTRTMAMDLAPYGILVNSISPGFTNTELTDSMLTQNDKDYLTERIPMGRFGEVGDIANLVSFFVSDLNTYVTGQDIIIDGGYSVNR
jgi:3-oxoacyl-[acyl-carrier protein] reductase